MENNKTIPEQLTKLFEVAKNTLYKNGDKVIVVYIEPLTGNDVAPPLKMEEEHTVNNICIDSKGNQHLDVGLISKYNFITSYNTGEKLPDGDKIHWCHPCRFSKK